MPRIAIGEIAHETNTFCPPTTLQMFKDRHWDHGEEILAHERGTRTYLGGMIEAGDRLGVTLIPTFATSTEPWGTITREAYDTMVGELIRGIEKAMPLDAVCLALHGAGIADGITDLEGGVLAAVRGVVGDAMPVAVTLDLHGNITPRMVSLATGLFGVHEYPHIDEDERGQEAVAFLLRVLRREIAPTMAIEALPLLVPASPTALDPARTINAVCHEWEERPGMIDCVFFHGFSYTDIPEAGATVVTVADGDAALARRAAQAVAREVWARREALQIKFPQPAEAVAEAVKLADSAARWSSTSSATTPGAAPPETGPTFCAPCWPRA